MRCFDCVCGIRNRNRIWCAKYKIVPTKDMAGKCGHFAARENTLRPFLKTARRKNERSD